MAEFLKQVAHFESCIILKEFKDMRTGLSFRTPKYKKIAVMINIGGEKVLIYQQNSVIFWLSSSSGSMK